jgi:4-amino-4-deoxy-L-arabinose transferase-like glycosyltransferase
VNKQLVLFLLVATTFVYVAALFIEPMEVDAAQYASIAHEMFLNHRYLSVLYRGQNYLDKPPLLFWLSVLSFHIFGVSVWAYKLPSFLFTILDVYATYRLAAKLYNKQTGLIAALILYTCQAFFLFNNDVRTDTLLTANVISATWLLFEFLESRKIKYLLFGYFFVALALLSKGPIGAAAVFFAIGSQIIYKREWKKIWWIEWWLGTILILILISPMLIGLYNQYGTYGLKFFFWLQSFGRITGQNVWHNDAGYLFFVHTFLWAFLPWSPVAVFALYFFIRNFIKKTPQPEVLTFCGFLFTFIALSLSHYKLPHYIFITFPFAAIFSANAILNFILPNINATKIFSIIHLVIAYLLWMLIGILVFFVFPSESNLLLFFVLIGWILTNYFFFKVSNAELKFFLPIIITAIIANGVLNFYVYPQLLKYQSGQNLANEILQRKINQQKLFFHNYSSNDFEFHLGKAIPSISFEQINSLQNNSDSDYVIGDTRFVDSLQNEKISFTELYKTPDFHISELTLPFLNPKTRNENVNEIYILEVR